MRKINKKRRNKPSFFLYTMCSLSGVAVFLLVFVIMWFTTQKDMLEIILGDALLSGPVGMYFLSKAKDMEELFNGNY